MDFTRIATDVQVDAHLDTVEVQTLGSPFQRGFARTPDMRIMFRVPRYRVEQQVFPHERDEHRLDVGDTRYSFIITEMSIDAGRDVIDLHGRVMHRQLIPEQLSTVIRAADIGGHTISMRSMEDVLMQALASNIAADIEQTTLTGISTTAGTISVSNGGTGATPVPTPAKDPAFHAPWGRVKRALHV